MKYEGIGTEPLLVLQLAKFVESLDENKELPLLTKEVTMIGISKKPHAKCVNLIQFCYVWESTNAVE